jgi:hypothetical protein
MSPKRWQEYKQVVASTLERDRRDWPSCLLAQCGDDVDLFLDASSLLAASRSLGDFIESPAWHVTTFKKSGPVS